MGPYCQFCDQRCFVLITAYWPEGVRRAYGRYTIAATCREGKAFERQRLGVCYSPEYNDAAREGLLLGTGKGT